MSPGLRLSIGVNVILFGVAAALLWPDSHPAASAVPSSDKAVISRIGTQNVTAFPTADRSRLGGPKITASVAAELKQRGVSAEVVAAVLLEDFNRRSTQQLAALQKKHAPRALPDRELVEFSRRCEAERIRELKDTLGEEGFRAWEKIQALRDLNRARAPGDELVMSAEESEQAYRLKKDFDQKAQELQMAMGDGVVDRADAGALQAQAQQALDQDLERLLGKQRFDELRGIENPETEVSRTYGDLKPTSVQAKAVLATEEEFRRGQDSLAKRLGEGVDAAVLATELKALKDAQEENLRRIFGASAYDGFQRQNDPTYKTLTQYAEAWDLKDRDIQRVYENLSAFYRQEGVIRSAAEMSQSAGQHVNWREVDAAIEQARQQTELGLRTLIGAERVWRLKQNGVLNNR